MEPAAIAAGLNALRAASDIAKGIRTADAAMQTADLKMKIGELAEQISDARHAMADMRDDLAAKDAEIARLQDALRVKEEVVRYGAAYYRKDDAGAPSGDPYCSFCFETKHALIHVNQNPRARGESICPGCKSVTDWQRRK